jgi:hypothetical protein
MSKAANTHALSIANRRLKPPPISLERALRRCRSYDIETVYGLIKAFGGFEAVASDYTCGPVEDIKRWAIAGYIPNGWSLRMFARAAAMDLTVNPSVFGFLDDEGHGHALTCLMRDARLQREGGAND